MFNLSRVALYGRGRVSNRAASCGRVKTYSTNEFGLTPPPPPPEVRNTSIARGLAAGGFLLFCSLLYKWNKSGDLLDGATLEDQDVVKEVLAGRDLSRPSQTVEAPEEQRSVTKPTTVSEHIDLNEALVSLRQKEAGLRETLARGGVTGGAAEDLKTQIVALEVEKAKIKADLRAV